MSAAQLEPLRELLEEDIDGVTLTPAGLRAVSDQRWGEVTIQVDPDEDEKDEGTVAVRVQVLVPPPAGAGPEFLLWALATNVGYWGVKIGLDEDGMLSVHADVEAEPSTSLPLVAAEIVDRSESILQLIDEDLTDYCLAHGLGSPVQRARWEKRRPATILEDDED